MVVVLDVLIAGAGPVGLWLAAESRLHGVEVTVVERRTAPDGRSRAVGMQAGPLDTFATRGLAERFIERGTPVPTGHFGAAATGWISPRSGRFTPSCWRSASPSTNSSWRSTRSPRAPACSGGRRSSRSPRDRTPSRW
ncbi:FAD-dependent monooxygenase [Kitasatospora sp. NPDC085895]|uniref:FAD-dependent monooxygenase n=1 Tax=Kitasatospora sp. NPDC085895 TaxID=3155057 RepID=UPI00344CC755